MAHKWTITDGDIYISKNGNDTTGNGSQTQPFASIEKAFQTATDGNKIVIGSGNWKETTSVKKNVHLCGDGNVVFDGSDINEHFYISFSYSESYNMQFSNIQFLSYDDVGAIYSDSAVNTHLLEFNNCDFVGEKAIIIARNYGNLIFRNCLLRNIKNRLQNSTLYNCVVFGGDCVGIKSATNTIFVNVNGNFDYALLNTYCNFFNCKIKYYNTIHTTLPDDRTWFLTSMSLDPKFNNVEMGDFTLRNDSPCLYSGVNGSNIGRYGMGYNYSANSSEFNKSNGATISQTNGEDDIERVQETINGKVVFFWKLKEGHSSGTITSAWIDFQKIKNLKSINLFANFNFNANGIANPAPDSLKSDGEKAILYDFRLRYCVDYFETTTAEWKRMFWNKDITIDNAGRGNADNDFVPAESKYISARFVQVEITIK